jgi:branched-chain amino acid transport system permease protein
MLPLLLSGLAMGCIYGKIAIGFSMIFRTIGLVNFAHGDFVMCGAFIGYTLWAWVPFLFLSPRGDPDKQT